MRRRLFYIYKLMVGRSAANRDGYVTWLTGLADWFEKYAQIEGAKKQELRVAAI